MGGRFNTIGTPALYLSLTFEAAVLEASHGFGHRLEPLTLCSYELDVDDILDFRMNAERAAAGVSLPELGCRWELDLAEGREPASWAVAKRLVTAGAAGILVPSFAVGARPDMANLVLWKWGPDLPHRVMVYDPSGRLPRDQLSWDTAKSD